MAEQRLYRWDGAQAKNINPWDLDSRPEAWTWVSNAPQTELDAMYYKVAASFRAVNKRAIAAASMPFQVKKGETVVDDSTAWENTLGLMPKPKELIKRVSMSQTFTNKAYLLRGRDILGNTKALNFLVPYTVLEITDPVTGQLDHFERRVNAQIVKYSPTDRDLIRLWVLDHTTELLPSKNTAAQAIFNSVGEIYFADLFIRSFYERGGVKQHVLAVKGAIWKDSKDEIERGWTKFLRGWSRFAAKILNADSMDVKPIGAGVDDLKNNEVYRQAIENIALGIGMPVSELLSDFDSFATAQIDRMSWLRDDIIPHVEAIAEDLNIQVFKPMGYSFEFVTDTTDAETEDEAQRATAYEIYTRAGIKPSIAAQLVGIELPEGVTYESLDEMAEERKEEEAEMRTEAQENALELQAAKKPEPAPVPAKWVPSLDELEELRLWKSVAQMKLRQGKPLDWDYRPERVELPEDIAASIRTALPGCRTKEDIAAVFEIEYSETRTQAPAYKTSELLVLAEALNNLAATTKAQPVPSAPAPNINVTLPPISMTANLPAGESNITFAPTIEAKAADSPAPQIVVNVPKSPAPVVEVEVKPEITVQPADVNIPQPKKERQKIKRDANGLITETETEIKY